MEELVGVLSGVLIPILVLAGVVIRAVGAVKNANSNAQKPPSDAQPVQPTFRVRPAPERTTAVPTLSGSAEPPRTAPAAPSLRLRMNIKDAPGEGSPLRHGSLESMGLMSASGTEHGLEHRIETRMGNAPILAQPSPGRHTKSLFAPSRNTLVQGILYAEILGRPGGRRARR